MPKDGEFTVQFAKKALMSLIHEGLISFSERYFTLRPAFCRSNGRDRRELLAHRRRP